MRLTFIQKDLFWEDKAQNLKAFSEQISALEGVSDLVVLPEMCTTGFSMNPSSLAEANNGNSISTFQNLASKHEIAIAGSHIGFDQDGSFYNRAFFIYPTQETVFYDKKHLFRMGEEPYHYTAGSEQVIVNYLGINIFLSVCYDLRFPAWLRNRDNAYDLLLVMANWPLGRQTVFEQLLAARAIENQAFVCGVNRIGTDGNGIKHKGGSVVLDAYGRAMTETVYDAPSNQTCTLNIKELHLFREQFPVWKDADPFEFTF